jgi:alpha-galactosidase
MKSCQSLLALMAGRVWRRSLLALGLIGFLLCGHRASQAQSPNVRGAFVTSDATANRWTIGNSDIAVSFKLTAAKDFVLEDIRNPKTGLSFVSPGEADSVVTINGTTSPLGAASSGWSLDSVSTSQTTAGVQLAFTFRAASAPVTVVRSYGCYPGSPAIEMWTTFRVSGAATVTVSNLSVWQLSVPATAIHYTTGLRQDAAGSPDDSAFTNQTAVVSLTNPLTLFAQNRSSSTYLPMISADMQSDEFFGGLLWSGSWQMTARRAGNVMATAATLPGVVRAVDAAHPLEMPHGFIGLTPGGSGDVSAALREFISGVRDGRGFQSLVTYNTWFAYGTDIDEQTMMEEMTEASIMGVELFVVDAGWYLGAGSGSDFDSGLGTWQVDPSRFPNGLGALRAYAHSLGLQFGLWVEPERVDRTTVGRPGLAHEEWLATNNGSYGSTRTAQICFASPAARQWVLDRLTSLLDQVAPDYLKWDNNLWVNCNRSGHGHSTTDGNFSHVLSLYDVLATLRARYPRMQIENCSQGGNRLDFGMLRYTDVAWMDDRTSPSVHVRHNLQGSMTFFPPQYLLSFLIGDTSEPLVNAPDLPLYVQSRMLGVLGLTYRATDLSQRDRDEIAAQIAAFKNLRTLVRESNGRLLTAQAEPVDGPAWDAVQELNAAGDAAIFAFQNDLSEARVSLQPQMLQGDSVYSVRTSDGTLLRAATGSELMGDGIEIDGSSESAAHVLLLQRSPSAEVPRRLR